MGEVGRRTAQGAIRVVLADDNERFVSSPRALIDRQPELAVVGEVLRRTGGDRAH